MFCPLEYRDSVLIFRGVMILFFVVILGVSVTQQQLNSLTQRQEMLGNVSIPYDQNGIYSIYLFGLHYDVRAVYPVGKIISSDKSIQIKIMEYSMEIPTYVEVDCKKELSFLDFWIKVLVKEAFKCKQIMGLYVTMIHEKINVYVSQFR